MIVSRSMSYGDPKAPPTSGTVIDCGPVYIKVGYSNGDFRRITVTDVNNRTLARGDVPYRVLRELQDGARQ